MATVTGLAALFLMTTTRALRRKGVSQGFIAEFRLLPTGIFSGAVTRS
jgi:hypothetical protein